MLTLLFSTLLFSKPSAFGEQKHVEHSGLQTDWVHSLSLGRIRVRHMRPKLPLARCGMTHDMPEDGGQGQYIPRKFDQVKPRETDK
jgi:hypothetical protein